MKKSVIFVVCLGLYISQTAVAENLGLGVSIKSNDASIYLPINVHEEFRVEPFISYSSYDGRENEEGLEISYKNNYSNLNFGIGFFKIQALKEQISAYYGLRSSYTKNEQSFNRIEESNKYGNEKETSGYTVSPIIGFEYSIINDLLVGFEAEWWFSDLEGKEVTSYGEPVDDIKTNIKNKSQGTNTRVTVRYFF